MWRGLRCRGPARPPLVVPGRRPRSGVSFLPWGLAAEQAPLLTPTCLSLPSPSHPACQTVGPLPPLPPPTDVVEVSQGLFATSKTMTLEAFNAAARKFDRQWSSGKPGQARRLGRFQEGDLRAWGQRCLPCRLCWWAQAGARPLRHARRPATCLGHRPACVSPPSHTHGTDAAVQALDPERVEDALWHMVETRTDRARVLHGVAPPSDSQECSLLSALAMSSPGCTSLLDRLEAPLPGARGWGVGRQGPVACSACDDPLPHQPRRSRGSRSPTWPFTPPLTALSHQTSCCHGWKPA